MTTRVLLFLLIITIIIMGTGILIMGYRLLNTMKERLKLDEYALNLEQDVTKSRLLMDSMVDQAVTEWSIYNIRSEGESFISDEKRDKCLEWVIKRVIENSTPAIIAHIGIGYPAENMEQLINSIKNAAMPHILRLNVLQNTKSMEDNIPNVNITF